MSVLRASLFRLATSARFERAVRALPFGERQAWRAASRYVAGQSLEHAWQVAARLRDRGVAASVDRFGELVSDDSTAERAARDYLGLADALATQPHDVWLAVDLSHLGLDVAPIRCAERLTAIAAALPAGRRIQVGAEDYDRADAVLACILAAAAAGLADRLGATVQANLHRTGADLDRLLAAGVHIRLVKGAYVEPSSRALPYGDPTDLAYLHLAHRIAESGGDFALATHDTVLREALLAALGPRQVEQLLGVRPTVVDKLVARGIPVRVYVPYGHDWFRYWMRRVAESRGSA